MSELERVRAIVAAMADDDEIPNGVACMAVNGDATALPFPDAAFERVIASEVVEHIPHDDRAFAELARGATSPAARWLSPCRRGSGACVLGAVGRLSRAELPGGHVRIYSRAVLRGRLRDASSNPPSSHHADALHSPYWWLRCAVGLGQPIEANRAVYVYHRLLCWDIEKQPWVMKAVDRVLNPIIGKSLVVYARKPGHLARQLLVPRHRPTATVSPTKDVADAIA